MRWNHCERRYLRTCYVRAPNTTRACGHKNLWYATREPDNGAKGKTMAKIVSDIIWSGSQGSRTFSHNKGGAYTRNRRIPVNPTTVSQGAVRNQLAASSANWANLSDADRNAW